MKPLLLRLFTGLAAACCVFATAPGIALAGVDYLSQRATLEFQPGMQSVPAGMPAHAALYSFSDVYRLTVAGPALAEAPQAAEYSVRVAAGEPQAAGYVFSIAAVKEPQRWLLLLSGLALAGWVARRRLLPAV